MLYDDVLNAPEIQDLKAEYQAEGIDFNKVFNNAIFKATEGIGNPNTRTVAIEVAMLLKEELQRALIKKASTQGTTFFGKAWRKIWNLFSKKKS